MIYKACRIWNLSVITVLVLTIYNIFLAYKLANPVDCPKITTTPKRSIKKFPTPSTAKNAVFPLHPETSPININLGRWDDKLEYKYFDNAITGTQFVNLSKKHKTCLATQSSLEKIHSIIQVAESWNGPISVAVFGSGDDEFNNLFLFVSYMRKCFPKIKERVSFHFAFPRSNSPTKLNENRNVLENMDCDNSYAIFLELTKSKQNRKSIMKWRNQIVYPQNHMRNLARKNCQSDYVFLTDIDVIPSLGMTQLLDEFLMNDKCGKLCAYVIPTFELDERVHFPQNKSELLRLADKGLARPFHQKVFIYNQFATNFSRWQMTRNDGPNVHVSHPVTNFEFLYEPFYVAKDTVPPHDERFVGYGYTRNTQVYEMFLAGYKFLVLSPIFTIHWGLQLKKSRPPWRESQNTKNMKKFKEFKRELLAKYKISSSPRKQIPPPAFAFGAKEH